jgi:hypothetical protein
VGAGAQDGGCHGCILHVFATSRHCERSEATSRHCERSEAILPARRPPQARPRLHACTTSARADLRRSPCFAPSMG